MIPLTERLLNDAGGWQAMKAARALHSAGRVSEASYESSDLKGLVREGTTQYRAGLKISGKTSIENLCTCRESRARGLICAHSLAVGLEVLKPTPTRTVASEAVAPVVPSATGADPNVAAFGGSHRFSVSADGEALTLFFILPPNLSDAWKRGTITVGFECGLGKNRKLLSALPPGAYRCAPEDLPRLQAAGRISEGQLPGMAQLNRSQAEQLLAAFIGHPNVLLGRERQIAVGIRRSPLKMVCQQRPNGDLRLSAPLPTGLVAMIGERSIWLLGNDSLDILKDFPGVYSEIFRAPYVEIPALSVSAFLTKEMPVLHQWFDIDGIGEIQEPVTPVEAAIGGPESPKFFLKINGSLNYLGAELEARAAERRTTITSPGYKPRNRAETEALERIRKCGFEGPTPRGEWALRGEERILTFFSRDLPQLEQQWSVTIGAQFANVTENLERVRPRFEIQGSGQNWFEVGFELATDSGERLSAADVRRLLAGGRKTFRLKNNKVAVLSEDLLDDFSEILKDTQPDQARPGFYRFDTRDAAYLQEFTQRRQGAILGGGAADWGSDLPFAKTIEPRPLGPEWEMLRSYQAEGVSWMTRLAQNRMGGVLADEMGLGKTVQSLAFLSTRSGPKLVVCPASLTRNWEREALRFAPGLKPCLLTELGTKDLPVALQSDRLFITSYGLLRRDAPVLQAREFGVVVLDEAQQIKNPDSQTAQAAHRLRAQAKLALTGTPIENGVRDIWSTMQFLMPGFLGSRESFRERFELPIRDQPGGDAHQRLIRRLKPFILRRTKSQVAKEIPAKIEQVAYCDLSPAQSAMYRQLMTAAHQLIHDEKPQAKPGPNRMAVLTALLRLRQVCCDPRLLEEGVSDKPIDERSAKLELLLDLLDEAIEDGHRVLVFSQFSSMLRLIGTALEAKEIDHCYLDGATRDRQSQVDRFQKGTAPVFLISLKAGGFGLNLTAADTVIHYDPWWNPAVEAQASDRVHRIGQTRPVNIYKLVARNTVEEKILSLQASKRELAAGLLEDDAPMMTDLSMSEIRSLVD